MSSLPSFRLMHPTSASGAVVMLCENPASRFIAGGTDLLLNTGDVPVDVGGWQFDDIANGGSTPYTFAAGTLLPAHGFRVFFRSETGVALNNTGGDDVRLLAPDGQQTQIFHFTTAGDDQAWSALPDGSDTWVDSVPPSPGASNQPTLGPVTVSVRFDGEPTAP